MRTGGSQPLAARKRYRSSAFAIDGGDRLAHIAHQALFDLGARSAHAKVAQLRPREPAITAAFDVGERRKTHDESECEAVVGAAVAALETERGDFRLPPVARDVDARRIAP